MSSKSKAGRARSVPSQVPKGEAPGAPGFGGSDSQVSKGEAPGAPAFICCDGIRNPGSTFDGSARMRRPSQVPKGEAPGAPTFICCDGIRSPGSTFDGSARMRRPSQVSKGEAPGAPASVEATTCWRRRGGFGSGGDRVLCGGWRFGCCGSRSVGAWIGGRTRRSLATRRRRVRGLLRSGDGRGRG